MSPELELLELELELLELELAACPLLLDVLPPPWPLLLELPLPLLAETLDVSIVPPAPAVPSELGGAYVQAPRAIKNEY